jgi:Abortive infection alpha
MTEIEAVANATGEVAKATGKLVDLVDRSKGFLGRVFGQPLETFSGGINDKLNAWRYENLLDLKDRVDAIHRERGVVATVAVDANLGLEIIKEAALTDNTTLKQKWALLLANAMDPNKSKSITRNYVEFLKLLAPTDAHVLQVVHDLERQTEAAIGHRGFAQNLDTVVVDLIERHSLTEDDAFMSLEHLTSLGLIAVQGNGGTTRSLAKVTIQEGVEHAQRPGQFTIDMTRVGFGFVNAVT